MGYVVLDTDVLSSASPGDSERAQKGWHLLQHLINECHTLLISPNLYEEYQRISTYAEGLKKLSRYAFTERIKPSPDPQDDEAWERLSEIGVDEKDIGWILLAASHKAVFVTWEKYAPRRHRSDTREREHQQVARAVEEEFGVCIWHPDYALKRLCLKLQERQR